MINALPAAARRAADLLQRRLEAPDLSPGDRIPAERVLAEEFNVSRVTLRKAIAALVEAGQLERRGTAGTYLPEARIARPLSSRVSTSVSEVVQLHGRHSGSRLLTFDHRPAGPALARRLGIEEQDGVVCIKRLRLADETPICIETSFFDRRRIAGLAAGEVAEAPSLYALLRDRFGLTFQLSDSEISVGNLATEDAPFLNLPAGAPTLRFCLVTFDAGGAPVEYLVSDNNPALVTLHSRHSDDGNLRAAYTDWSVGAKPA